MHLGQLSTSVKFATKNKIYNVMPGNAPAFARKNSNVPWDMYVSQAGNAILLSIITIVPGCFLCFKQLYELLPRQ